MRYFCPFELSFQLLQYHKNFYKSIINLIIIKLNHFLHHEKFSRIIQKQKNLINTSRYKIIISCNQLQYSFHNLKFIKYRRIISIIISHLNEILDQFHKYKIYFSFLQYIQIILLINLQFQSICIHCYIQLIFHFLLFDNNFINLLDSLLLITNNPLMIFILEFLRKNFLL